MAKLECVVFTIAIVGGVIFMGIWFSYLGFDPMEFHFSDICRIDIRRDLSKFPPLLLKPSSDPDQYGYEMFYIPEYRGDIILYQEDVIELSCPNGKVYFNNTVTTEFMVPINCTGKGRVFETSTQEIFLSQYSCSKNTTLSSARYTNKTQDNLKEIQIGFQVNETTFIEQMIIYFDPVEQTTAYSAFKMTKYIGGSQTGVDRPKFLPGDFYKVSLEKLYKNEAQRQTINAQLGLPEDSQEYINSENELTTGHLAAKADFLYGTQQRATFYYVNTAPQWKTFNGGNWNQLEISIRNFAENRGLDLDVYTGTHEIMTLPHNKTGKGIGLYLYVGKEDGENGKEEEKSIPIPKFFWKVLVDPTTKAGVAFVGLNNPYIKKLEDTDTLCDNICKDIKFDLSWKPDDFKQGYGYCCEVNQLRAKISIIPDLKVVDLLV